MPLVFPVLRIPQKLWGGPPVRAGPLDPLFANRGSLMHNGQAGQGAGRGPGGPPHNFCRPSGYGKNERTLKDGILRGGFQLPLPQPSPDSIAVLFAVDDNAALVHVNSTTADQTGLLAAVRDVEQCEAHL